MIIKENKEYQIDNYNDLRNFCDKLIEIVKENKIKYLLGFSGLSWREDRNCDKLYDIDTPLYVVFENDYALLIEYYFYSLISVTYRKLNENELKDIETNLKNIQIELPIKNKKVKNIYFDKFNNEYCINPATNEMRKEGIDYFGKITFELDNNGRLMMCAEDSLTDGYLDIWYEEAYSFENWNVDLIQKPEILEKKLSEMQLVGKKIKNIRSVGALYDMEYICLEESEDDDSIKEMIKIDEPIVITFEDNERLEIDFSETSSLKIGINALPQHISWGINPCNVDLNVFFQQLIGKIIEKIEVTASLDYSGNFTKSYEIPEPKAAPYINEIIFYLENNYKMVFNSNFDYGEVSLYHEDKIIETKFENIKKGILKRMYT